MELPYQQRMESTSLQLVNPNHQQSNSRFLQRVIYSCSLIDPQLVRGMTNRDLIYDERGALDVLYWHENNS